MTPAGGFTGPVTFTAALVSATGTFSGCYVLPPATVTSTAVVSTITVYTNSSSCATSSVLKTTTQARLDAQPAHGSPGRRSSLAILSAGLLLCLTFRKRLRAGVLIAIAVTAVSIGLVGCSNSATPASTTVTTTAGSYVIRVTGASGSLSASTSFTLVVQ